MGREAIVAAPAENERCSNVFDFGTPTGQGEQSVYVGIVEPNVHFSPDQKWIIFRANFEGHTDVYAVEIKNNSQAGKNVQ